MAFEQRENSFLLFPNDNKQKDTHPDYKASKPAIIGGKKYWVAAWRKEGRSGMPFISVSLTEAQERDDRPNRPIGKDEIPF